MSQKKKVIKILEETGADGELIINLEERLIEIIRDAFQEGIISTNDYDCDILDHDDAPSFEEYYEE